MPPAARKAAAKKTTTTTRARAKEPTLPPVPEGLSFKSGGRKLMSRSDVGNKVPVEIDDDRLVAVRPKDALLNLFLDAAYEGEDGNLEPARKLINTFIDHGLDKPSARLVRNRMLDVDDKLDIDDIVVLMSDVARFWAIDQEGNRATRRASARARGRASSG